MMTSRVLPHPEECNLTPCTCRHLDMLAPPCPHGCPHEAINFKDPFEYFTEYTPGLRRVVTELLHLNRSAKLSARELLRSADRRFQVWRKGTPDGRRYVDLADDLKQREANMFEKLDAEARESGVGKPAEV